MPLDFHAEAQGSQRTQSSLVEIEDAALNNKPWKTDRQALPVLPSAIPASLRLGENIPGAIPS